jgi:hypothetical protein
MERIEKKIALSRNDHRGYGQNWGAALLDPPAPQLAERVRRWQLSPSGGKLARFEHLDLQTPGQESLDRDEIGRFFLRIQVDEKLQCR